MKLLLSTIFSLTLFVSLQAQSVQGKLTLNGKSETKLDLKTNSAVQLFKEFKTGKYRLKFNFKSKDIPQNIHKETIVFFEFVTIIKKDGELVKNVVRKQPIPYFPGDMDLPAEAFDFISSLAFNDDEAQATVIKKGLYGIMDKGSYTVQLIVKPVQFNGEVAPLEFSFTVSER